MKLVIFGATGRTGMQLVQQGLDAGYDIVAFVRTPTKLTIQHPHLHIVQGDSTNPTDVENAIQGVDAVICALGASKSSPRTMMADSARNIAAAMKHHGVRRIITLTGAGVSAPEDKPKPINHLIKFLLKLISPRVLADSEEHVRIIQNSGLDWTVVRGPVLNDGAHTGSYRVGWVGVNTSPRVSRADAADFMLKIADNGGYTGKMPMVSD